MAKRNQGVAGEARLVKEAELAAMLDVTPRRIRQLADEGTVIKTGPGEYELHASVLGYIRRASGGEGYEADKARLMKAKADRAEIETAQRAGKLVMTDRIGKVVADAIGIAVSKLVQVGDKVAPLCILERAPGPAADLINAAIRAACEEICAMDLRQIALDEAESMDVPDASADDYSRVKEPATDEESED